MKEKIKEQATLYLAVQRVMLVPLLMDVDIKVCLDLTRAGNGVLNERGVVLKNKAQSLISFYKEAKVRAWHHCFTQPHF